MPYRTNHDLPPPVRHVLPAHAQDIYRAAFNNACDTATISPIAKSAVTASPGRRSNGRIARPQKAGSPIAEPATRLYTGEGRVRRVRPRFRKC